ncbi:glutathione S-transferase C-terminal domain-containing protein isoform X1 [Conger conger]|uniref:glutathione S-transferase C-terminal domain-containing protein isoform X1 n=1 Tax=Conger conger TaxID=82655 RepID=UPI002A5A5D96|nr:glutathione S-transferase C-terminal domain-containing protein isoform X1 [Conger conger]XP_061100227.1 glutathione S-transferase C-terminal domain-containing protein isoform X1 [Conger conger]
MTSSDPEQGHESLYLELNTQQRLPLHTSITLFLLSYCDCRSFRVFLVSTQADSGQPRKGLIPEGLGATEIQVQDLPALVRSCRLPAVLDRESRFCRAGLAVVLRHIIARTCEREPARKDVAALLGFKKTCLKACAEVSQWTRLCELSIPSAVQEFLRQPGDGVTQVPGAILLLEKKLAEPVKVHNDDKIRRQKLQLQQKKSSYAQEAPAADGLELSTALANLSELQSLTTRGPSDIRKVKTTELPPLEHVFAEGLYFTLTDVVLLPCVHSYLQQVCSKPVQLPLLCRWYLRVQEVPGVCRAAADCGIAFLSPQALAAGLQEGAAVPAGEEPESGSGPDQESGEKPQVAFTGGPRPTMTKLKESGITAVFSPHPCPYWALDWDSLPAAVNPTEGKMSDVRAVRKRQQLNNLVAMVTRLARSGDTVVDFCSGGGHVGIALAHTLPDCQVVLIENKEQSLVRAESRCTELGLRNVGFVQANLDYFTGPFQIGVALHACGVATDMVMDHCVRAGAAFVVSPCCYGFIQNTLKFTFPRSQKFLDTLSYKEHMILCRFADQTAVQLPPDRRLIGKQCMGLVDLDRSWTAEAHGYSVQVMTMEPDSCSPKNNMLVGVPAGQNFN